MIDQKAALEEPGRGGAGHITIEGLTFSYGKSDLFSSLNLSLATPGLYGLFGRNGSGKSTLLKLICGLLTPGQGSIVVQGANPRKRAPSFLEQIYLLPEEFHLPNLTASQLQNNQAGFYPRFDARLYKEYLHEFEVPLDQRFAQMSLGQRKKAVIAFALAASTPLLLMDEPTNGLDIESRLQFKALMTRPQNTSRAIIISTHQAHDLESLLSHLWFLDQGKIVLDLPMRAISERIEMGVAPDVQALPGNERLLYKSPLGAQWAWIARTHQGAGEGDQLQQVGPQGGAGVQLELLYQAISLEPERMLSVLGQIQGAGAS